MASGTWFGADAPVAVDRDELTVATFNIWFDDFHAEQRYLAIADLLCERRPDVIVLQEVTPAALEIFLGQPWLRDQYLSASAVGGDAGNYGMLMLSRVPITRAAHSWLPTRQSRGFLDADFCWNDARPIVCCLHLDSGKSSARLRGWQLGRIFRAQKSAEDAVLSVISTCATRKMTGSPRRIATYGPRCGRTNPVSPKTRRSITCASTRGTRSGRCGSTVCFSKEPGGAQRVSNCWARSRSRRSFRGYSRPITSASSAAWSVRGRGRPRR